MQGIPLVVIDDVPLCDAIKHLAQNLALELETNPAVNRSPRFTSPLPIRCKHVTPMETTEALKLA